MPSNVDPLVGKVLDGRYRFTALIGEGRTSTVYEAVELAGGRQVALRLLHFQGDCAHHLALRHENIISTYAIGQTADGLIFLANELVRAPLLHHILGKLGALGWERTIEMVAQLCNALHAAQAQGISGPLTPRKIYLDSFDLVRVDFSPRPPLHPIDPLRSIQGQDLGPYEYMSPEHQLGRPHDSRSEVYSLGVLAYELLTGQLPFTDERSLAQRVMAQRAPRPRPPSLVRPLPAELDAVVVGCLEHEPGDRHADVLAVRDAVLAIRAALRPAAAT